tara:strand:- start:108 stop:1067 length:960 start_codon:yes stop_codon:yes gene_type:complete
MNLLLKHKIKIYFSNLNLIRYEKTKSKIVLMYHGIIPSEKSPFNNRFISVKQFENQIKFLKKEFNIISLDDYFLNQNLEDKKVNVAITFDDGYKNNFKYAFPILKQYNVPAHFFVTGLNNLNSKVKIIWSDLIDIASTKMLILNFENIVFGSKVNFKTDFHNYFRKNPISGLDKYLNLVDIITNHCEEIFFDEKVKDFWQLMNDDEINAVSNSNLVSIGSHGYYHNNLSNLSLLDAKEEINRSIDYLNQITNTKINSIGFPDGSYCNKISDYCLSKGLKFQCAVNYLGKDDDNKKHIINRLGIYPPVSPKFLEYQIHNS